MLLRSACSLVRCKPLAIWHREAAIDRTGANDWIRFKDCRFGQTHSAALLEMIFKERKLDLLAYQVPVAKPKSAVPSCELHREPKRRDTRDP